MGKRIKHLLEIDETHTDVDKYNFVKSIVCKGESAEDYSLVVKALNIKYVALLELALVYGRYNILEVMLEDEYYSSLLTPDYNPFDLTNCKVNVSSDVNDGSHWGNDEHERSTVNYMGIKHEKCFNLLEEKYNKRLNINNFMNWYSLRDQDVYYRNYFPKSKLLLEKIYKDETLTIKNVINNFESLFSETKRSLLKFIKEIFTEDEILKELKE